MDSSTCRYCNETKPIEDFVKDKYAVECKSCKAKRFKRKRDLRGRILYHFLDGECSRCGLKHDNPSFFDFHHRNPEDKIYEVKQMICSSWDKVLTEVAKCDMLCPNCHREVHLNEDVR